jgi:hypothetical protein
VFTLQKKIVGIVMGVKSFNYGRDVYFSMLACVCICVCVYI